MNDFLASMRLGWVHCITLWLSSVNQIKNPTYVELNQANAVEKTDTRVCITSTGEQSVNSLVHLCVCSLLSTTLPDSRYLSNLCTTAT